MTLSAVDPTSRRAVIFTPMEARRNVLVDAAIQAESLGYEAVIIPEGWGLDATIVLSEIALRTTRIRIVAGILSVWGRTPGTLAMTAATLDDLSDGRFALGLGASTRALAAQFHDTSFRSPTTKLRDTIGSVKTLLSGDRAPVSGDAKGLRLGQPPRPDIPIWVAGLGPKSVSIAAELADAWLPVMVPRSAIADIRDGLLPTANECCELVNCVMSGINSEAATGRTQAEQMVGWYLTGMGPLYGDFCAERGFAAEVAAVRAANPRPAPGSICWPEEADALLPQLAVFGDQAAIAEKCAALDAQVDVTALCIGPGPSETISALIDAAAPMTNCVP